MRANTIQASHRAAARLRAARAAGPPEDALLTATDCPENGGLGCHGDDGTEGGHCPHGWLTAAMTEKEARRTGRMVPDDRGSRCRRPTGWGACTLVAGHPGPCFDHVEDPRGAAC